jgi:hypothetical protein
MSRQIEKQRLGFILAFVLSIGSVAGGEIIALYDAGVSGSPPAPPDPTTTEGGDWTYSEGGGPGQSHGPVSGDLGWNAWNITDTSTAGHSWSGYVTYMTPDQVATGQAFGWRLTARLRIVDDFGGEWSPFVGYDDGGARWGFFVDLDENGDLAILLDHSSGQETHVVTSGGVGATAYHVYEFLFDPATGTAEFSFDGNVLSTGNAGSSVGSIRSVSFAAGSSLGTASANYNFLQWETLVDPCVCEADLNNDGLRDGLDVQGFVDCLTGGDTNCGCADLDGVIGLDYGDVAAFVDKLLLGELCP